MEAFSNVGYNYNPNNYGSAQARSQMANANLAALGVLYETVRERSAVEEGALPLSVARPRLEGEEGECKTRRQR